MIKKHGDEMVDRRGQRIRRKLDFVSFFRMSKTWEAEMKDPVELER